MKTSDGHNHGAVIIRDHTDHFCNNSMMNLGSDVNPSVTNPFVHYGINPSIVHGANPLGISPGMNGFIMIDYGIQL